MTSNNYKIKKISNIAMDLIGNRIVFFIGAGFSRDLNYPGWGELLKNIIAEHGLMRELKQSSLFYLLSNDEHEDFESINDLIIDKLIGVDFLRLAGYVDLLLRDRNKDIHSEIKEHIYEFESKRVENEAQYRKYREAFNKIDSYITEIITTNYDTNIEYCLENVSVVHRNLESINNNRGQYVKDNIRLYKIHGCIEDEKNEIVITEEDYQNFNSSNKYILNKIYSTFMENNIVFIGYSLNDPNIRSLLSEVIDEIKSNKLQQKKIYWINRDRINETDKKFYENTYSIQIIDQTEILSFLDELTILTETKWKDLEMVEAEWEKAVEDLVDKKTNDTTYTDLINKINFSEKKEQVLTSLFNKFTVSEGERDQINKAFFKLISHFTEDELREHESKIIDILAVEGNHILYIIEILQEDERLKQIFIDNNYMKKFLETLISVSNSINDFYLYKRYATALLDFYQLNNGQLWGFEEEFIDAFISNYRYLTYSRTLGYSWESLNDVKHKLNVLSVDMIEQLLEKFSNNPFRNKIQKEQMSALLASLDERNQCKLKYRYIIRPKIDFKLERQLCDYLEEILTDELNYEESWDEEGYVFEKDTNKISVKFYSGLDKINFIVNNQIHLIKYYVDCDNVNMILKIDQTSIPIEESKTDNIINAIKEILQENIVKWLREDSIVD
ncbi:hypothetical protein GCM10011351_17430 [Paraliobacillus quinghaiensis]|uniref:SIR2-like domain-containing protein n=1 Tax=Paraliobacillus quinghaiensis TaxID=470815 RepID=A0A917TPC8_9BACI|nr:SIR2 family protein [Paraliobacillus quinghaiensis]GGM31734.1 hypothetical protein GCM10011351_17430 [Paraliobacillus quinghaiensis]